MERKNSFSSFDMSSSTAAATAAALLFRCRSSSSSLHRCCTFIARDGGATASASGRCNAVVGGVAGRSFSSLLQQPLSTPAALRSTTSPFQRLVRDAPKACPRGFAGSSPFSTSNAVETSPSSPSSSSSSQSTPSEPSPSFVRLNNIFPSPGSKSQVQSF